MRTFLGFSVLTAPRVDSELRQIETAVAQARGGLVVGRVSLPTFRSRPRNAGLPKEAIRPLPNAREALNVLKQTYPHISSAGTLPPIEPASQPPEDQTAEKALEVLSEVRQLYRAGNKSGNKFTPHKPRDIQRQKRARELLEVSRQIPNAAGTLLHVRAHNCEELATLAVGTLTLMGLKARIHYFRGDHAVAICTHIETLPKKSNLPDRLEEWPSHIHICDPWANVACPANTYREQFSKKMQKWREHGKMVTAKARGELFYLEPRPDWISIVLDPEGTAPERLTGLTPLRDLAGF